jgi:MFS transporter, DHA1 family, multidrug resistance protein
MERIERILSRPTAKPYRTRDLGDTIEHSIDEDGILGFGQTDIENSFTWSPWRRGYITLAHVLFVLNATFASSVPSACLPSIIETFKVPLEAFPLVVTVFLLGYCAWPLTFAPLSEFYGRRWVFYITFIFYFAFTFLCAFGYIKYLTDTYLMYTASAIAGNTIVHDRRVARLVPCSLSRCSRNSAWVEVEV